MTTFDSIMPALISYCHLEYADLTQQDLDDLKDFYLSAVGYMTGAGVKEPSDECRKAQYFLCVKAMVLDSWDNRGTKTPGVSARSNGSMMANETFKNTLSQLKATEP